MKSLKKQLKNNPSMEELVSLKERSCNEPTLLYASLYFISLFHCFFFLPQDIACLLLGFFSILFFLLLFYGQSQNHFFQETLGRKALTLGCPMKTRYLHRRGSSGWATYVYVNEAIYYQLLSLKYEEIPLPSHENISNTGPFIKKYLIEFTSSKEQVGHSIPNYEHRHKTKKCCVPILSLWF